MYSKIKKELTKVADKEKAQQCLRFFKTGKGEYGEGDKFIGVSVPEQRRIAKKYLDTTLEDLVKLASSKIHEYRLTAFMLLVYKYEKSKFEKEKKLYFDFYIKNRRFVNNWDIVDVTTPKIMGAYLLYNPNKKDILYKYAKSKDLWERRIAILATYTFIRAEEYKDTMEIAKILLHDQHDLIHKAVGWMLREVGNRDLATEEEFLKKYYKKMPRTMLRYAIEKFAKNKRQLYLKK